MPKLKTQNHNSKLKYLLVAGCCLLIAGSVLAADYTLEEPFLKGKTKVSGPAEYIHDLFVWGLGMVGLVALVAVAYGGFVYLVSGGSETTKSYAKEIIWGAIYGLLLLFCSYLILYIINPDLVKLKEPTKTTPGGTSSDAEVRQNLTQASNGKITFNAPEPQTSLNGLRPATISGILSLWNACGQCDLVITGGTESGHEVDTYSHANGYKIDLRPSTELNNAIYNRIATSCQTPPPANTNCSGIDGNVYRYENDHWDACLQCHLSA